MSDRLTAAVTELIEALREEVRTEAGAGPRAPDRLLSVDEASAALGIQRSKLYALIGSGSGELRSVKVGRRRLVPAAAVAEFIDGSAGMTHPVPDARRLLAATLRVRSSSNPSKRHTVVINPSGKLTCSCPAGWHRKACRHVRAVLS